ncbi:MAG: homocysteine S-methyltransferase family protein [Oscillospiraceae bacterium]|nr:homocysteine S-methyltransferase family protein [Oscillospiraceae bacterium]
MLTREQFQQKIASGVHILDGATGSNLRAMGMPNGYRTELWVFEHPHILQNLQRQYAEAGSQIIFAPTFQAQPIALQEIGLENETEQVNARLVALTREAAPDCLIAGDITTLSAFCDSWNPENMDLLVANYRRQIRGLIDGGVDILGAETLLYPNEAEAILIAAELEGAGAMMYSFTMQSDGSLFSGMDAGPVLRELERSGAAAVGFNCVAADAMTPGLVAKLRRYVKIPLICKPNGGMPVIGDDGIARYDMTPADFGKVIADCEQMGATLLGGCCGTTPAHIGAITNR